MDKKLIIANWKSHKTKAEAIEFFEYLKTNIGSIDLTNKELIIAPPFTLLAKCRYLIDEYNLPLKLSSQNVSSFPEGAYTGEISARQVKELADYVIVGHSERRKYMHEDDNDIENKIKEAKDQNLTVIQCIQDERSQIHKDADVIAYEPPTAIGSGNPDDPEHIAEVFKVIEEQSSKVRVLYGGSVDASNIHEFLSIEHLDGFLVGGASLDAKSFISLISW